MINHSTKKQTFFRFSIKDTVHSRKFFCKYEEPKEPYLISTYIVIYTILIIFKKNFDCIHGLYNLVYFSIPTYISMVCCKNIVVKTG